MIKRLLFLILFLPQYLLSVEIQQKLLTVSGEATIYAHPDEVSIYFGIVSLNKDIKIAKKENDEITKKVIDLTKEFNIDKNDINLDFLTIYPKTEYNGNKIEFTGYEIRKNISIFIKDISKYENFIGRLLSLGVYNIYNIEFRTSELKKYEDEARLKAIKMCEEKAKLMAEGFKIKLKRPVNISEIEQNITGAKRLALYSSPENITEEIAGKIVIKSKVIATYEIE